MKTRAVGMYSSWDKCPPSRTYLEGIIKQLAAGEHKQNVYNPYREGKDQNNAIRRHNLRLYLTQVLAGQLPPPLLVCEAPGYRGCRITGIPLCSRKLLLNGVDELGIFGRTHGYLEASDSAFQNIHGEQSATIVWNELRALGILPLIWNAFPWHPHRRNEPLSNRTPTKDELALGREILAQVIEQFHITQILAIGRSAQGSLRAMGISHVCARHPAHGGKQDFAASLRCFATSLMR